MKFTEAEAKAKIGTTVRLRQPLYLHTGDILPMGTMGRVIEAQYVEADMEDTSENYGVPYTLIVRWDIPGEPISHFDTKDYWHFLEEV